MNSLFRPEALDGPRRRLQGEVLIAAPIRLRVISTTLATIALLLILIAANVPFTVGERITGTIVPSQGLIYVRAEAKGVIEQVTSTEGELVSQGTSIARIRSSTATPSNGRYDESVHLSELKTQRTHLQSLLRQAELEVAVRSDSAAIAARGLSRARTLVGQGFLSSSGLDRYQTELNAAELGLIGAQSRMIDIERQIADVTHAIEADQSQAVAPVRGRVVAIVARSGQFLEVGEALAVILPETSKLEAELWAPTRAAGFLREGQNVRLSFDAFPHRRYGTHPAEVSSISQAVLQPGDIEGVDLSSIGPAFRVQADLEQQYIVIDGARVWLRPGMQLSAEIVVDRSSLISRLGQWLKARDAR